MEIAYADGRLRVDNDGARPDDAADGSGLRGLRERLAPLGASLVARAGRRRPLGRRGASFPGSGPLSANQGGLAFMIRILLADDEHLIRTALAQMLDLEDDLSVVAEAAQGDVAVELAIEHAVDVAVLDLQMPELDGIAVAEQLAERLPGCGCVIVTSHGRPGPPQARARRRGARVPAQDDVRGDARRRWSAPCTRAAATSTPSWRPRRSPPATAR